MLSCRPVCVQPDASKKPDNEKHVSRSVFLYKANRLVFNLHEQAICHRGKDTVILVKEGPANAQKIGCCTALFLQTRIMLLVRK